MTDTAGRIRRITTDLRGLQQDFYRVVFEEGNEQDLHAVIDELLDFELVTDLKSTVDYMRHVLWAYIEAAAKSDRSRLELAVETSRLNRATEMLKLLRMRFGDTPPGDLSPNQPRSFVDQINSVMDQRLSDVKKKDLA
jgi:hypothetical protein